MSGPRVRGSLQSVLAVDGIDGACPPLRPVHAQPHQCHLADDLEFRRIGFEHSAIPVDDGAERGLGIAAAQHRVRS